jgi:hypothetical protein
VIKAELQAMLNTLAESNFHDAFKNGRYTENDAYAQKRTTLRVVSRPKVCSGQMVKNSLLKKRSVQHRFVMMQQPVLLSQKFRAKSSHIFMQ